MITESSLKSLKALIKKQFENETKEKFSNKKFAEVLKSKFNVSVPSESTLSRFFSGDAEISDKNLNLFANYVGFDSYNDFIADYGLLSLLEGQWVSFRLSSNSDMLALANYNFSFDESEAYLKIERNTDNYRFKGEIKRFKRGELAIIFKNTIGENPAVRFEAKLPDNANTEIKVLLGLNTSYTSRSVKIKKEILLKTTFFQNINNRIPIDDLEFFSNSIEQKITKCLLDKTDYIVEMRPQKYYNERDLILPEFSVQSSQIFIYISTPLTFDSEVEFHKTRSKINAIKNSFDNKREHIIKQFYSQRKEGITEDLTDPQKIEKEEAQSNIQLVSPLLEYENFEEYQSWIELKEPQKFYSEIKFNIKEARIFLALINNDHKGDKWYFNYHNVFSDLGFRLGLKKKSFIYVDKEVEDKLPKFIQGAYSDTSKSLLYKLPIKNENKILDYIIVNAKDALANFNEMK